MNKQQYWEALNAIGWFGLLPEDERHRAQNALHHAFDHDPKLAYFSLAVTSFDPECIEGDGPDSLCSYHSVLQQLAEASYGFFTPSHIHDELDEVAEVARVQFDHAGHHFAIEVPWESDWFEYDVLVLVNDAIKWSGATVQFMPLPSIDQRVSLALIPPATYRKAVKAGLIPAEDQFPTE
jgi:hypothetical protein